MKALALTLILALAAAASAETRIYQWTDEEGTVHFSNHPPEEPIAEESVTRRTVEEAPLVGSVAPVVASDEDASAGPASRQQAGGLQAQLDAAEERKLLAAERRRLCERGRRLVTMIEPADRVQVQKPDGTVEWLYGEERIAELQRARKMVEENC